MAYDFSNFEQQLNDWVQQAQISGWLDTTQLSHLLDKPTESANSLFNPEIDRPLVVAFMGGTGVGKSSLLNQLADEAVAVAGVERPTSRQVTLFYHQSIELNQLRQKFPLQQIKLAQHSNPMYQQIIWIDMPDFDSTEEKNRAIVMEWLNYIDVLIYVVSPERYRDKKAWQLLLTEGKNHAWVFVMNQWDKGDSLQLDDFKQQLSQAGFQQPLIFKTSCTEETNDDLSSLQTTIQTLANEKTVTQLEQRASHQYQIKLRQYCQQCLSELGQQAAFDRLLDYQVERWQTTKAVLQQGFDWPIKQFSQTVAKSNKYSQQKLWDDWAQTRLNDFLDDLLQMTHQQDLPLKPCREAFKVIPNQVNKIIQTQLELGYRTALLKPGNALQRGILKVAKISEFLLPFTALSLVSFQVFQGFYQGAVEGKDFLGVNFVAHSLLLILISWLFPFFIAKKMQPSLEKAALKGLYKGLNQAFSEIEITLTKTIGTLKNQHLALVSALEQIIEDDLPQNSEQPSSLNENKLLTRMLVEK